MDEQDKTFLEEILMQRMEVHYKKMLDKKTELQKREEAEAFLELEERYNKALESLLEADRKYVEAYIEDISNRNTDEGENYYRCGFDDGLRCMGLFIKYYLK